MTCQEAKRSFLTYIDLELSSNLKKQMDDHLSDCAACQRELKLLAEIYRPAKEIQKIEPAPFLWQKLYLKISQHENRHQAVPWLPVRLLPVGAQVVWILIFSISVLLGIYLGSSPNLTANESPVNSASAIINEDFENDTYINSFDNLPSQSLGKVYLTMELE